MDSHIEAEPVVMRNQRRLMGQGKSDEKPPYEELILLEGPDEVCRGALLGGQCPDVQRLFGVQSWEDEELCVAAGHLTAEGADAVLRRLLVCAGDGGLAVWLGMAKAAVAMALRLGWTGPGAMVLWASGAQAVWRGDQVRSWMGSYAAREAAVCRAM
ncbi:hypothetical protein Taro_013891 [Colocasia esculenta]|uniref:Uncharacterized protein n=1 Tax=Colocasia esculenta TaxID=4460 RepID=A0A843UHQ6_COLES|nr:hypothetical protein [Colocasia esculenta]